MSEWNLPLIVEPYELEQHLGPRDLLMVDLSKRGVLPPEQIHAPPHVPGAVHLPARQRHRNHQIVVDDGAHRTAGLR